MTADIYNSKCIQPGSTAYIQIYQAQTIIRNGATLHLQLMWTGAPGEHIVLADGNFNLCDFFDDLQIPCPLKPGKYHFSYINEYWLEELPTVRTILSIILILMLYTG